MKLPPNIPKRGLSVDEAAEYCGVSAHTLERHGPAATKIGGRTIYDRKALDLWLDQLSGVAAPYASSSLERDALGAAIDARKNAVRHKAN